MSPMYLDKYLCTISYSSVSQLLLLHFFSCNVHTSYVVYSELLLFGIYGMIMCAWKVDWILLAVA